MVVKMEYTHVVHTFGPVVNQYSQILILGSVPSVTSPANAAWNLERLTAAWREAILTKRIWGI